MGTAMMDAVSKQSLEKDLASEKTRGPCMCMCERLQGHSVSPALFRCRVGLYCFSSVYTKLAGVLSLPLMSL